MKKLQFSPLLLILSGCVPMVLSVYAPVDGAGKDVGRCGWSNISVVLLEQEGVRITAGFQSSSDIGLYAVGVSIPEGKTLEFETADLSISSAELAAPISLRFASYKRGWVVPVTRIVGPQRLRLAVVPARTPRPHEISVSLPPTKINGKAVAPAAVSLRLQTSAALVGLCQ